MYFIVDRRNSIKCIKCSGTKELKPFTFLLNNTKTKSRAKTRIFHKIIIKMNFCNEKDKNLIKLFFVCKFI